MLWKTLIDNATTEFESAGIADPELNAELLAASVLGLWKRNEVRDKFNVEVADDEHSIFQSFVTRRLSNEPLQYITGETEFYGLRLYSSSEALIPRPDTEILVEEALKKAKSTNRILDIGTGSGAIILALASRLPEAHCVGIDISAEAISLAEKNRDRLQIPNVHFEVKNIFDDIGSLGSFDIIVSNPPYISIEDFADLEIEVREFEPRVALTDGDDGFMFYHRIIALADRVLRDDGYLLFETGYSGARRVVQMMDEAGFRDIGIVKDLAGIERVVMGKLGL